MSVVRERGRERERDFVFAECVCVCAWERESVGLRECRGKRARERECAYVFCM